MTQDKNKKNGAEHNTIITMKSSFCMDMSLSVGQPEASLYLQQYPVALGQAFLNHGSGLGSLPLPQGDATQPADKKAAATALPLLEKTG